MIKSFRKYYGISRSDKNLDLSFALLDFKFDLKSIYTKTHVRNTVAFLLRSRNMFRNCNQTKNGFRKVPEAYY